MLNIDAEDDGLRISAVLLQPGRHVLGNHLGALINDEVTIVVLDIVLAILNFVAINVDLPLERSPVLQVDVQANTDHLVRSEKAILDSLFQTVGVDRLTEVVDVRHFLGFFRCCRHTNVDGAREIVEDTSPQRFFAC